MCLFLLILFVFTVVFAYAQQVYIVGWIAGDNHKAVYWLNGVLTELPSIGSMPWASAIAFSGSNVYIVGRDDGNAVYWLNGIRTVLSKTSSGAFASASASDIAISGSNIYIVGSDGDDAVYWLNGIRTVLPKTGRRASASAIAISGSNVYITGRDGDDNVYWLNSVRTVLPRTTSGESRFPPSAIAISGNNVYIIGWDGYESVYWLNGVRTVLEGYDEEYTDASAIAISGSNVYITGNSGIFDSIFIRRQREIPLYWLNGKINVLQNDRNSSNRNVEYRASASAIAISGSNVYIAGIDGGRAVYWLNGVRTVLPGEGFLAVTAIGIR